MEQLAMSPLQQHIDGECKVIGQASCDSDGSTDAGSGERSPPGSPDSSKSHAEDLEEDFAPLLPIPQQRRAGLRPPLVLQKSGIRVAVTANGSNGDVFPLIALSLQLRLFHHTVRMFIPVNFVDMCQALGLDVVPVFADSYAVMVSLGGMAKPLDITAKRDAADAWSKEHPGMCIDFWDALVEFEPQAIVAHTPGLAFTYEAKKGVPVLPVYLSRSHLDSLKTLSKIQPTRPSVYCCCPLFEAKGPDVIPGLHHTAEWVLYEEPRGSDFAEGGPLVELRRFLVTGPAPVAVGWGSMIPRGMTRQEMLGLALRALRLAGRRGVILGGWAELEKLEVATWAEQLGEDGEELSTFARESVCFVNEAPHAWLFPQCCCVVHHGGIGVLHTALRMGKPAVITPIYFDQFAHSADLRRLGAGVGLETPLPELSATELAQAISYAEARAAAAAALGQKMRQQVGERDAAVIFDEFFRRKVMTGLWGKSSRTTQRLKSLRKT